MAHYISEKQDDGTWKKISHSFIKDGDWKKLRRGWVKINATQWKLFYGGGFPQGIILPFNSTGAVPNSNWEEYTELYDKVNVSMENNSGVWVTVKINRAIIGSDSTKSPKAKGGIATLSHTGKVSNAGTHGGIAHNWNASFNGDGDCRTCIKYDGDTHEGYNRGGHIHSNISGEVRIDPNKAGMRFLKASTDIGDLPPNVGVMSHVDILPYMLEENGSVPPGLSEISSGGTYVGKYMNGDSVVAHEDGALIHLSKSSSTSYAGSHAHGGVNRTLNSSNTSMYAVNAGYHNHTGYVRATTNEYPYHYLSMWSSASDVIESCPQMIGMWEGTVAPSGWVICNGLNGTPDLRNKFIRYANSSNRNTSGGLMRVGLGVHTDTNGGHHHKPSSNNSNELSTYLRIKHIATVGHSHISTDTYKSITPVYHALSFIMKIAD